MPWSLSWAQDHKDYYICLGRNTPSSLLLYRQHCQIWSAVLSPRSSILLEFHYEDAGVSPTAATVNKQHLKEFTKGAKSSKSDSGDTDAAAYFYRLNNVIKCDQVVLQTACSRKAVLEITSQNRLKTASEHEGSLRPDGMHWMRFCSFASTFHSFSAGVQLLWQFSSWVLSHQRQIRLNSPFTFVYEEIPLHCLLRPLPLLKSRHHSDRKQGQEWCHICERTNMQLHGCPLVLQDKVTVSAGCNNLDKKITCIPVKTESDIFSPADYFRRC